MFIERKASSNSINNRRKVHGVGINDAPYTVTINKQSKQYMCPYYKMWKHMLERCYSEAYILKQTSYINCIVESSWLIFSNFKAWMQKQNWKNKVLDKDILIQGNKIYGKKQCIFVSQQTNNIISGNNKTRGKLPIGVNTLKNASKKKPYFSRLNINGKNKYLGYFSTIQEASNAYNLAKYKYIIEHIKHEKNKLLKSRLTIIANEIKIGEYYA